ncbi:hypothetical protein CR513_26840, partial [Mucuna pruriens]
MAFLLPNLQHSLLAQSKSKDKPQTLSPPKPTYQFPICSTTPSSFPLQASTAQVAQVSTPQDMQQHQPKDEFYLNLGLAVRTIREDLPFIFIKDLNYDIYRDDITFMDPLNTFTGIEKYKLIFWALRFHGKILFRDIAVDVYRVWQPSENVILVRWNLRGVPRVPWEAKGEFQGTSRYKLDRNGKIYEHKVDNLAFNFPQNIKPVSVLDLVTACPASPNPTFLWGPVDAYSSSWIAFYKAVRDTLDQERSLLPQDGLATFYDLGLGTNCSFVKFDLEMSWNQPKVETNLAHHLSNPGQADQSSNQTATASNLSGGNRYQAKSECVLGSQCRNLTDAKTIFGSRIYKWTTKMTCDHPTLHSKSQIHFGQPSQESTNEPSSLRSPTLESILVLSIVQSFHALLSSRVYAESGSISAGSGLTSALQSRKTMINLNLRGTEELWNCFGSGSRSSVGETLGDIARTMHPKRVEKEKKEKQVQDETKKGKAAKSYKLQQKYSTKLQNKK